MPVTLVRTNSPGPSIERSTCDSAAKFTIAGAAVTDSTHTGSYVPANTVDGSLSTRWAASGNGVWIQYDLGATKTVSHVKLAFYLGDARTYTFDVQVSSNGTSWTNVLTGQTNAANTSLQTFDFTDVSARYVRVEETGGTLGFITPMTHNFCESCNRVRVTCTGTLFMCLGQEDAADLRTPLRASEADDLLDAAIDRAIARKPKGHDFIIDRKHQRPAVSRHMSVTGG